MQTPPECCGGPLAAARAGQAQFWLELRPYHLGKEIQFLSSSNYAVIPMKNHLSLSGHPPWLTASSLSSLYT